MNLMDAFKAAFDSLVRTYSPMIIGAALAGLAIVLGVPVPEEVTTFVTLLIAVLFQMLWYGILRVIELVRGKASKLLGLGLVKSEPKYATRERDDEGAITLSTVVLFGVLMVIALMLLAVSGVVLSVQMGR